jgi:hypothetical protein
MANERKYYIDIDTKNIIQEDESGRQLGSAKFAYEYSTPMENDSYVNDITSSGKFAVILHDFINKGNYFRLIGDVTAGDLKDSIIEIISPMLITVLQACGKNSLDAIRNEIENTITSDQFWESIIDGYDLNDKK